jgi:hypothetical protein
MKKYSGARTIDGVLVTVDGVRLDERFDLERYVNSWFEWGYPGAAPRQLALALLADHLNDDAKALELTEPFMAEVVAVFDNEWELTGEDIDRALRESAG